MRVVIMVEGPSDKDVLERVLEDLQPHSEIEFFVAHGRNAGRPIARRLLMQSQTAVAFIYDADTADKQKISEEKRSLEDYFAWAADQTMFLVQPMIPELETLFFEEPATLESSLGIKLSREQQIAARFAPKEILTQILKEANIASLSKFASKLGNEEIAALRRTPSLRPIREFVERAAMSVVEQG